MNSIVYTFIVIGCFFNLVGSIGLHRFPDIYTRLHAATKCTTFGSIFLVAAVMIQSVGTWGTEGMSSPQSVLTLHAFIALVCIVLTNPTSAHAIARAAHRSGVKPARAVVDDLEGDRHD
ncbi:MAG: Na+/H+ antiporter subunit G [Chloroflexi bacterium]|nr:Na+/H+ antiporter subunit G [Chloroflexota bacterium]MCK4263100.1 Na+/H+ antiporter subunit G [Dehalococcoidia bacterium]MCK4581415.1 Na+/H+ antiporter subunit G [Dehalococcoidia bacterium]